MTPLGERLVRLIRADGPLPVSDYMARCLFDPEHGYYTTRQPFGTQGDFTTAPEISQMFGELVAVWLVSAWDAIGRPVPPILAEIGPGRGTLMADMLRTVKALRPDLARQMRVFLIEASPGLEQVQRGTLAGHAGLSWARAVDELPDAPLLIVGNELFDAIPFRQYVKGPEGWRERVVDADETGLRFGVGAGGLEAGALPAGMDEAAQGAIVELAPARGALMQQIAARIAASGGAGLFFDYGYEGPALGDTFQALSRHRFSDTLAAPGEHDLTSHVDFSALAAAARAESAQAVLLAQGEFLLAMGLLERAGQLGAAASQQQRETISQAVERLAGPDQMGNLFKVLAVMPRGVVVPSFTTTD